MTKLSEKKGGGLIYNPPMMQFDGSTGYYDKIGTYGTGNKASIVMRFNISSFTGNSYKRLLRVETGSGTTMIGIGCFSSDWSSDTRNDCIEFYVANSASTGICQFVTHKGYMDGNNHTLVINFDGDAGTGSFIIDGSDAVDTGHASHIAPTTGTLAVRSGGVGIGGNEGGGSELSGAIGFCGYDDSAGLDWTKFMDSNGNPKVLDESTWAEWGAQPLFWHSAGKMDENKGSAGAMTENGTITLTDVGYAPLNGLPTIGTAESHHIKTGKVAWVDGVEKIGAGYFPAMMQFDGGTGSYQHTTVTTSGNKVSGVVRFKRSDFIGDTYEVVFHLIKTYARLSLLIVSSDHSTLTNRHGCLQMDVQSSTGVGLCKIISTSSVLDNEEHVALFSFDGDTGTTTFIIDGVNADDTSNPDRIAPAAGTLETGTGFTLRVGGNNLTNYFGGQIGFVGYRDAYLTNWQDFMDVSGSLRQLDTIGWTQWNGGTFQTPMMTFDGSTGYYNKTGITTSGNKVTVVLRFQLTSYTGDTTKNLANINGATYPRFICNSFSSDFTGAYGADCLQIYCQDTVGGYGCILVTPTGYLDGNPHTLMYQFDGDTGTGALTIDGQDAIDTGSIGYSAPTTTTLQTGTSSAWVGSGAGGANKTDGSIGFFGYAETVDPSWSDFMELDGTPKEIDEISWRQWGSQPLFWNKGGLMTDNKGSAGAMTANGTITGPIGGWPLFWNEHGDMENNLGSAGNMTKTDVVILAPASAWS